MMTPAGLPAIEALIREGINVNVTLLFAVERYVAVTQAFKTGLRQRHASGAPVDRIASVASFFVSRVDSAVDSLLAKAGTAAAQALQGKAAIANAKLAYRAFAEAFSDEEFGALAAAGAQPQRLLWASTSTKNPAYRDVLYVEELVGWLMPND